MTQHSANPRPVVIDTDPGLDDALALIVALRSPELDVAGITTVAGNIGLDVTTRNALRMLALLGRPDIPVVEGAAEPLARPHQHAAEIHGGDGIGGVVLPEPPAGPAPGAAVAFLRTLLDERPAGTLRILALGPLTNIARLILDHPGAAARAERIVAMGGAVRDRGNVTAAAEFNVWADPEAFDVVLRSGLPFTIVPLDVTRRVLATPDWSGGLEAVGGPLATAAAAMIRAYLANIEAMRTAKGFPEAERKATGFPLHDPCVMLHALAPELFRAERLPLRIVCDRSDQDGATLIDPDSVHVADVLTGVEAPAALALAFERLSRR
jgi:purine nucleosidase